jgi:hypothetical protein
VHVKRPILDGDPPVISGLKAQREDGLATAARQHLVAASNPRPRRLHLRDSVKKVRDFVDDFASAAKDVGLEPNDAPTPDQADKLKSKLHLPDKGLTRALQTLAVWTGNLCPS